MRPYLFFSCACFRRRFLRFRISFLVLSPFDEIHKSGRPVFFIEVKLVESKLIISSSHSDCQFMLPISHVFGQAAEQHVVPRELRNTCLAKIFKVRCV